MSLVAERTEIKTVSPPQCYAAHNETALSEIYGDDVAISIWQRELESSIAHAASVLIASQPTLQFSSVLKPENVDDVLLREIGSSEALFALYQDVSKLVDMFCLLFDLSEVGLRIKVLDAPMCPLFHVDKVPCRLITTYCGVATQWIPNPLVDRSQLGFSGQGKPGAKPGICQSVDDVRQLHVGDVALLKGESWPDNQGAGLVHRSPEPLKGQKRLLLTIDFCS